MNIESLVISSPKRTRSAYRGWEGYFPYYAGYPLSFADQLIQSAGLSPHARVFDPWNGSGTTTFAASDAGVEALGLDLNPVMVVVARARGLPFTEADALLPIIQRLLVRIQDAQPAISEDDPLLTWYTAETASEIRGIEQAVRELLIGPYTLNGGNPRIDLMSAVAATFYVALFSSVRSASARFRTTNPTWTKRPRDKKSRLTFEPGLLSSIFSVAVENMAFALHDRRTLLRRASAPADVVQADCATYSVEPESADLILTSPPYCTRIDYVSATRIELAILSPLAAAAEADLKMAMLGSTCAPANVGEPLEAWGGSCLRFLEKVQAHSSKASATYYYRNHVDYYSKLYKSLSNVSKALTGDGIAVMVVQDSHYKEIHNPVPTILSEMLSQCGLSLVRRENYHLERTMAARHRFRSKYRQDASAIESVLCFSR